MSIYGISSLASYPEAMPIFYIHSVVQTRGIFGADRPLIYGLADLDTHTHSLMAKEKGCLTEIFYFSHYLPKALSVSSNLTVLEFEKGVYLIYGKK